ncbi:protein of unknown function [Alkalibacterium putridalgicola]|uniref:DUF4301 domain-containing protein n=1 Tax=Alkalibacterium putridalgicola TaxID=426703 RepID=A0A1H7V0S7_9LACT|nr:DUF4301 family protein [Alkalibacterium putridalgicola]GEK89696.1 hypothetical protein APU01nite_17350 [Alkalibacterium putridalgicola]SEM02802.1 protein of unknown function [Alkalibacterium putridalgicola]
MEMDKFKNGNKYVDIVQSVTAEELTNAEGINEAYTNFKCMKFIPASGAATRMFKDLYTYLENREETPFVRRFFENLHHFAFYKDLVEEGNKVDAGELDQADKVEIIDRLLTSKLKYGNFPKALIKMHAYEDAMATPIDEHIFEGEQYLDPESVNLHFTIAPEHEDMFTDYISGIAADKPLIAITYSFQKEETKTPAADMENEPFLLEDGEVLYRPGGRGSLLENLNDLDADILFIKNVDNVCHRSQVEETIQSKKELASVGLKVKTQIDAYIKDLKADDYDLDEIEAFLKDTLNISLKKELTKDWALYFLDRPLRVCGMVKNSGEPGGGPFVVDNGDYLDLQICEKSEIDLNDPHKQEILNSSQFFNPVDLVCFVKDYKGQKFNLTDYRKEDRYFITEKSYKGRPLKALEHPGLWNGSMHHWNTLFVEVPESTFNPVKNVNDLLREGHRKATVSV